MLYNRLRDGGYTMDVDTATQDMSENVMKLICEVADEKGLDEDWINNDSYRLSEAGRCCYIHAAGFLSPTFCASMNSSNIFLPSSVS